MGTNTYGHKAMQAVPPPWPSLITFLWSHLARARRHDVSTHSCDKIQMVGVCWVRKMTIIYKMKGNLRRTPLTFISTNLWVGLSKEVVAAPF